MSRLNTCSPLELLAKDLFSTPWLRPFGIPAVVAVAPNAAPGTKACCTPGSACERPTARLALDIEERESNYLIHASLPGFRKDEISVEVEDGVLTIAATRAEAKEAEKEEAGVTWHARERRHVNFARSIRLPEGVTGEGIQAELKDGVLAVHVPKPVKPEVKGRKIVIN